MTGLGLAPGGLMRAEIAEQPQRWLDFCEAEHEALVETADRIRAHSPTLAVLVARGTSDHAAIYGQYLIQDALGIPALLATPSLVSVFGRDIVPASALVLALSQSGESPDLVGMMGSASRAHAMTVAITNSTSSTLASSAQLHIDLRAGLERSVAATKSYTAELLAIWALVSLLADNSWSEIRSAVELAADQAHAVISAAPRWIGPVAARLAASDRALVVGRGYSLATAKEAALKLMETSGIAASGWSAADVRHGPLGQVRSGTPVVLVNAGAAGRDSIAGAYHAVQELGGDPVVLGAPLDVRREADIPLDVEARLPARLLPLLEILPLQQLALEVAVLRGKDPDRPVGLTKVTRTL